MAQFVDMDATLPCVFRGVFCKNNDTWCLLMGQLVFADASTDLEYQACWQRYPRFQFISWPLEGVTLSGLMNNLHTDGRLPIGDLPVIASKADSINWTASLIPSHANEGAYPVRRFAGRVFPDVHCQDSKLIAHGQPFHLSAFEHAREFLQLDRFHGTHDARLGELSISLPDRRGHISQSDQAFRYDVGTADANTLSVVGVIDGEPVQLNSPAEAYTCPSAEPADVELWLVSENDEIVDYRSSSEGPFRHKTALDNNYRAQLLQTIASGESEACEFKKYINLADKKNDKAWELDKTVCAFSNHEGGKLFIGVDDEAEIVGINEDCQQTYKCDPREGAIRYQEAVTKRLLESLLKNQCFSTELIELCDQLVLVVNVSKANGLNEILQKSQAYIRRGASSRLMKPAEILAHAKGKDALDLLINW